MASNSDPVLKRMLPFLRRADEIQKVDALTAFYCRMYSLEEGMSFPKNDWSEDAKGIIVALVKKLEKDKKALTLSPDDQMHVEGVALRIFGKADKQDRAGRANQDTARTYYAAASFIDVCRHFDRELNSELVEKQKYALWRAAEINKAIREGREPTPPPSDDDSSLTDEAAFGGFGTVGSSSFNNSSVPTDEFGLPILPGSSSSGGASTSSAPPPQPTNAPPPSLSRDSSFPPSSISPPLSHQQSGPSSQGPPPPPGPLAGIPPPPSNSNSPGYTVITSDPAATNPAFGRSPTFGSGPQPDLGHPSFPQSLAPTPGPPPMYTQPKPPAVSPTSAYPGGAEPTAPSYPSPAGSMGQGMWGAPPPPPHASGQTAYPGLQGGGGGGGSGPLFGGGGGYGGGGGAPPPSGFVPSPDKVAEAHKAAKAAVSALGFSDVKTGVEYLQHALNLLTRP